MEALLLRGTPAMPLSVCTDGRLDHLCEPSGEAKLGARPARLRSQTACVFEAFDLENVMSCMLVTHNPVHEYMAYRSVVLASS